MFHCYNINGLHAAGNHKFCCRTERRDEAVKHVTIAVNQTVANDYNNDYGKDKYD